MKYVDLPATHFHNSGDNPHRRRLWHAFQRLDLPANRVNAFAECGLHSWIAQTQDDPADYVVCKNRCRDRFCPHCSRLKANTIAENLHRHCKGRDVRFMTFTLVAGNQPLHVQLTRLYDCFRRLRASKLWQRTQRGGAAFLEVKIGKGSGRWHPHLHVVSEGKFVQIKSLKAAWERITNGSHQVDVQRIRDAEKIARYVCKYVSKPYSADSVRNDAQLDELLHTLSGTRAALTYGSWRGLKLCDNLDDRTFTFIMTFDELKRRVAAQERYATELWNAIALRYERPDQIKPLPTESHNGRSPPQPNSPTLFNLSWYQ